MMVMVTCAVNPTFSISAAVSGLAGTLVLLDNGGDDLTFTANGTLPLRHPDRLRRRLQRHRADAAFRPDLHAG